jgi:hypothetical protein
MLDIYIGMMKNINPTDDEKKQYTYNPDACRKYYEKPEVKAKKLARQKEKYNTDKCPCGIRMANIDHMHSPKHYKYLYEIAVKEEMKKNEIPDEKLDLYLWKYLGKFFKISIKINNVQRNKYIKNGEAFYKHK